MAKNQSPSAKVEQAYDASKLTIHDIDWHKLFALHIKHHGSIEAILAELNGDIDFGIAEVLERAGRSQSKEQVKYGQHIAKLAQTWLYLDKHGQTALRAAEENDIKYGAGSYR